MAASITRRRTSGEVRGPLDRGRGPRRATRDYRPLAAISDSTARPPGCTPAQCAMKSERQAARMALVCFAVGRFGAAAERGAGGAGGAGMAIAAGGGAAAGGAVGGGAAATEGVAPGGERTTL